MEKKMVMKLDSFPKNNKPVYFTFDGPSCFVTSDMTIKEALKFKKHLEELGFTVRDATSGYCK